MKLFHSENMHYISLFMRFDDAPLVSVMLAESGIFEPAVNDIEEAGLPDRQ